MSLLSHLPRTPISRLWFSLLTGLLLLACAAPAWAQDEAALKAFFEGHRVTLKIAMPATSDGVDIRPEAERPLDMQRYTDRLGQYGTALPAGDTPVVTLVKLKKDLIEFQLDGGGYGTFGDDTSTTVDMPLLEKSNYEKDLEQRIKTETNPERKRGLQRDLDDIRNLRERENRRIKADKAAAEELKRARLSERRLTGGSRFNIRYQNAVPAAIRPQDVVAALFDYVDFTTPVLTARNPSPVASPDAVPRKGMLREEAERLFGRPVSVTERREGALTVTRVVFVRGEQRINAEFVEDVLIRYTLTSR